MPLIRLKYKPREPFNAYHERTQRFAVIVTHRGAGKTWAVINDLIKRAWLCPNTSPRFFYLAPYRVQAKAIAWDALKRFCEPIPERVFNESDLSVLLPGDRKITLYGADNFEALRGLHFDGGVVDETEDIPREAIDYVLSFSLLQRKGWLTEIGTIKGSKGLYKKWDLARNDPSYFTLYLKASQSGLIPPDEIERLRTKNPVAFAREMELDPNAEVAGSIYGPMMSKLRETNRIQSFAIDSTAPVYTFWDLGQSDYVPILFCQFSGRDVLICDYYCANGQVAAHYADYIGQWRDHSGRRIAGHFIPHDGGAKAGPTRTSWKQALLDAGLTNIEIVPRIPDKWVGINQGRELLPSCYIHQANCSKSWELGEIEMPSLIDCLDYYHSKEMDDRIHDEPVHDQYSHGADAYRTLAEAHHRGMIPGTSFIARETRVHPRTVHKGINPDSYGTGRPLKKSWGGKVLR